MSTTVTDVVCPFCGCLCDDLVAGVDGGRVVSVRRACTNGRALFTGYDPAPLAPSVAGRQVDWDTAIAEAARILVNAACPLIFGLSSTSSEAQRKAVELADRLGAIIDTNSSICHGPTTLAMQRVGQPSCTLGEVRNHADLIIFWGCNPAIAHPRHFARYSLPASRRRSLTAVVIDVRPTATAKVADWFLQIPLGADWEILTVMRALVQGKAVETDTVATVLTSQLQKLAEQMKTCHLGVIFAGVGLTMSRGSDLNVSEMVKLVAELNTYTRFATIPMRGHGNVTGADQVMTWQSGYPFAVSFARGYPCYGPGEFSAVDVLARGEADAALIIAADPLAHLPGQAAQRLKELPTIVLDPVPSLTTAAARVVLPTARCGVDAPGTFYRMDGVPIRLRPVLPAQRPTDEEILMRILGILQLC
jgi:formylmethanofuran dehydrogenase subunit B